MPEYKLPGNRNHIEIDETITPVIPAGAKIDHLVINIHNHPPGPAAEPELEYMMEPSITTIQRAINVLLHFVKDEDTAHKLIHELNDQGVYLRAR